MVCVDYIPPNVDVANTQKEPLKNSGTIIIKLLNKHEERVERGGNLIQKIFNDRNGGELAYNSAYRNWQMMRSCDAPINQDITKLTMTNDNGNRPAYPAMDMNSYLGVDRLELRYEGITKRELIAAMAMQGILSNSSHGIENDVHEDASDRAVRYADELLKQLESDKEK